MNLQVVDGGTRTIDIGPVGQGDGRGFDAETLHDVSRDRIQEFDHVIAGKKLLAEFVKTFGLAAALIGALCLPARSLRQLAGDDGSDQESKQGDPILRIGNGQGADRRKKVVVESQSGD